MPFAMKLGLNVGRLLENRQPNRGIEPARSLALILMAMRPRQWLKNVFVLAPIVFSGNLGDLHLLLLTFGAVACFCGLSGAIYLINDICDRRRDAVHPVKRRRPIASGALSPAVAGAAAVVVAAGSLTLAASLGAGLLIISAVYICLMIAYCTALKNVAIAEVLCISAGFVLRAVAGGVVIDVPISHWLFICTALVSLFLALGKRRHELSRLEDNAANHRPVLREYNEALLDQMISITATSCLVSYLLYCVLSEKAAHHPGLLLTAPIVAYGLFHYLHSIYCKGAGGSPEEIVLKDKRFLGAGIVYAIAVFVVMYAI
jgi:4-hydroxybenzoate polyprenyltransferase